MASSARDLRRGDPLDFSQLLLSDFLSLFFSLFLSLKRSKNEGARTIKCTLLIV